MAGSVLNGIDVLERDVFAPLRGQRIGLVTNHTGLTADGRATADVLHAEPSTTVTALFGPEHGIRGLLDEDVPDGVDAATGLPVYSLYGERRQPSEEQLAGVDTLVFDIQDIGCRFYTYISTLGNVLEAAGRFGKRMVVLDRVNPVTGAHVEGPLADKDKFAFVAYHDIPVRHGMTVGELALLFNVERGLGADVEVVRCDGWRRGDWFDAAGLQWTNPSPNMRSQTQAAAYPGIGLLEMTNVSVGRGTDTPFEVIGAPYIDARILGAALNVASIPGARFVPVTFTPSRSVFAGEACGGVNLLIVDRDAFDSVRCGLTIASTLCRLYPDLWEPAKLMTLLVNQAVFDAVVEGRAYEDFAELWRADLERFAARRAGVLLY